MNVRAVFQYGFYSGVSGRLIWEQKEAYVSQAGATLPQMLSAWRNFTANAQLYRKCSVRGATLPQILSA